MKHKILSCETTEIKILKKSDEVVASTQFEMFQCYHSIKVSTQFNLLSANKFHNRFSIRLISRKVAPAVVLSPRGHHNPLSLPSLEINLSKMSWLICTSDLFRSSSDFGFAFFSAAFNMFFFFSRWIDSAKKTYAESDNLATLTLNTNEAPRKPNKNVSSFAASSFLSSRARNNIDDEIVPKGKWYHWLKRILATSCLFISMWRWLPRADRQ